METICTDLPTFLHALNFALELGSSVTAEAIDSTKGIFTITAPTRITQWLADYGAGIVCTVSVEDSVSL